MSRQYPDRIWHNGAIKPWAEATVHVMAHALHYGSSVFEGIRCYDTPSGPQPSMMRPSPTFHSTRPIHSAGRTKMRS